MSSRSERRHALAAHVRAERARRVGTKADAVKAAGVARATWDRVESGGDVNDYTYAAAERVLGWPSGSILRYVDGDADALPATPNATERPGRIVDGIPVPAAITALFSDLGAVTTVEKVTILTDLTRRIIAEDTESGPVA